MVVRQRIRVGSLPEVDVRIVVPAELLNQELDVVLIPVASQGPRSSDAIRAFSRDLRLDLHGYRFDRDEIHDPDGD